MRGLSTLLIVLGFGSAALSFVNIHYTLLAWADAYQPAAGLVIGSVGLLLLIVTSMFSKDAPAAQPVAQQYPPQQGPVQPPQGYGQPAPYQGQPQGYAPQSPPQGFAQPVQHAQPGLPQGYAPASPPQGFAQPGPYQGQPPVSPPQGFPQPQAPAGHPQQGRYAPPQSFGPQG